VAELFVTEPTVSLTAVSPLGSPPLSLVTAELTRSPTFASGRVS